MEKDIEANNDTSNVLCTFVVAVVVVAAASATIAIAVVPTDISMMLSTERTNLGTQMWQMATNRKGEREREEERRNYETFV